MIAFCAICVRPARDPGDLRPGEDGALECRSCREDPPIAIDGPDRSYEPTGGTLTTAEIRRVLSAKIGEERYRRESERNSRAAMAPSYPLTEIDRYELTKSQVGFAIHQRRK